MQHRFFRNPTFCGDFFDWEGRMTCHHVPMPGGGVAIVCTQTRRCKCGRRAPLLCDWKVPGKRSGTCDAPICEHCATSPQPGKDLCAKHAKAFEAWKASRPTSETKA